MTVITLTTDFGVADGYVATMKGVILAIHPTATLVDITHEIPPQDVRRAAYVLETTVPFFPPGAVHVAVVDPGVGSARRAIAIRRAQACFVGPDNGLFSFAIDATGGPADVVHLDKPDYWLPAVSRTFHGRDVFSPVAAHLAAGVPFAALGTPIDDPVTLPKPQPWRQENGCIVGEIETIDRFGNLISNIPAAWLAGSGWRLRIAAHPIAAISPTYAAVAPGELVALIGSSGRLEISVRNGNAAERLDVSVGEPIEACVHES